MDRLSSHEMMVLLDEQLKNAQKIQQKIIPKPGTFQSNYYSFYSYIKPFRRVGGDFFDFDITPDENVSLLLSDATGHGIDAAMLTGMVKLIYSYAQRDVQVKSSPSKILRQVDHDIEALLDFSFFSSFALRLDPKNQKLYWANAGHPPAMLIQRDCRQLTPTLPLIGVHNMFAALDYSDKVEAFRPGDKIILFTDGFTDGSNAKNEPFGIERIQQLVEDNGKKSINMLCQELIDEFYNFTEGAEAKDDLCLLGLEYDK